MKTLLSLDRYSKKDLALAKKECAKMLKQHPLTTKQLAHTCQLSVVTPVYDERVSRIKKQLEAFNRQVIDPAIVELVYIVNNPTQSKTSPSVLKNNAAVIQYLKKAKSKIPVILIDRSSVKNELRDGNVGEARNFANHVVVSRYLEQGRDGIILQTDADTYPMKTNLFKEILREVPQKNCIGASGGVRFVLSLDSAKKADYRYFAKHLEALNRYVRWGFLFLAWRNPKLKPQVTATNFSGANTVTLAIAAICSGGVPSRKGGSDYIFSKNIEAYAKKNGYFILPRRDRWIMATSFRESKRTTNSYGNFFDKLRANNGVPMVIPPTLPAFDKYVDEKLRDSKKLSTTGASPEVQRLLSKLQKQRAKIKAGKKRKAFTLDAINDDPKKTLLQFFMELRKQEYPLIPLTEAAYQSFKKQVYKDPRRKPFAQNAIKYFATFHLK